MPTASYQLVSGRSLREVGENIARLERDGYRRFGRPYKTISTPSGGLAGNRFFQAMLKEENEAVKSAFRTASVSAPATGG